MSLAAKQKRLLIFKVLLLVMTISTGVGALAGGIGMLIAPDGSFLGMQALLPYFQVLPFADVLFQNFTFPGIALIIVNGITNLVATAFIFANKKVGYILGTLFGVTLMMWITIQFCIFPMNFMDILYFIFGVLQMIFGLAGTIFFAQTQHVFHENDYAISPDSPTLVLYFSRMGYSRKKAYEIASKEHADIFELQAKEPTKNTSGFWWCGRFGMHVWPMEINPIDSSLLAGKTRFIIVSPMWVFHMCGPVRGLLVKYLPLIKDKTTDFYLVHFMNFVPACAKKEIVGYLPRVNLVSVISKYGKLTVQAKNERSV